jgi:hypothetical protein
LRRTARRLEAGASPSARRQRAYRERQQRGEITVRLTVDEQAAAHTLMMCGALKDAKRRPRSN